MTTPPGERHPQAAEPAVPAEPAARAEAQGRPASSDRPIRIVVVDDHALVRAGVREIVESQDDMVVVGEAADSEQGIAEVAERRPDIVLLDVELPGGETTDTVARIRTLSPGSRVVVFSMCDGAPLLRRLIAAGVHGYLHKSVDREELVRAVRGVHAGRDRELLANALKAALAAASLRHRGE